jgi:hypothetical protein
MASKSHLWVFTVIGLALIEALKRAYLGCAERPIKQLCKWLDPLSTRNQRRPASFAVGYLVVARKCSGISRATCTPSLQAS